MGSDRGAEIDQYLAKWQERLNLQHWRITYRVVASLETTAAMMSVKPDRLRTRAEIHIREDVLQDKGSVELEQLFVHELVHLVMDGVAEEHTLQWQHGGKDVEYKHRMTREIEKTVENLSLILTTLAQ